jgi:AraC-like DNA-binding protein
LKSIVQKSAIPENRIFVVKELIAPYFDSNWHFHREYQLFLVLKGKGTRFVGDNIKRFKENDLVFTGPNVPHLWRNDNSYFKKHVQDQTRGIVIYFQPDLLGASILEKEEMEMIRSLFQKAARGLEIKGETNRQVSKWMIELLQMKGVGSVVQLLRILNALSVSPDCHPIAHAGYVNSNKESGIGRMNLVYEYVMKNFSGKLKLEEVAALANMSVSSFSRYFKSRANKSFSDFVSEIRIGHACRMLHEEDYSVSRVCYESGFHALSNFNKQFKAVTGKTPLQHKKAYLEARQ